ncbi:hypothetical protein M406DRAFT_256986 [Cryphonectria parasitica EP155]|uniref:Small ribosomal subunit protein uS5m n=1 Tax=Cryphonectria parasitica (strain ATCC 38755 / EP155) TaxID=660469 RepID=A0A9P5CQM2_CRYP1|nr:uncharacterized protein M406DRAFT_256986 [Cryphonectria parasitica EP155]KAF3766220.1 hypothetical protein M406DRAFT_256986 [Cryphonectria parasitica EP155]
MSVATPAASRLLCRSLAANSAKTSSRALAASRAAAAPSSPSPCHYHHQQRHQLHTTTPLAGRRKRSPFRNVKAEKMGLLDPERPEVMQNFKNNISADYDDADLEALRKRYTPEQLEALQIGEHAVSAEDLVVQGRLRNDPYRMMYHDDFATVRPHVDKRVRSGKAVDTSARFMTPDEFGDDFLDKMLSKGDGKPPTKRELIESMDRIIGAPEMPNLAELVKGRNAGEKDQVEFEEEGTASEDGGLSEADIKAGAMTELTTYKYLMERNSMTGFDGGINDTALAPELPEKIPGVAGLYKQQMDESDAMLDPEGKYQELKRQTGMSTKEIINIFNRHCKILVRRYVSNQTRLGKIRSSYVLAIAGNENGRLGMGEAKSVETETATQKAKLLAIRNMQPIRRYEDRTIYGNVAGKVGATVVNLYARPPGFGLRVSHRFFEMARAAGISDLAAKMPRSRNPMNSVKACFQALTNQPDPEQIARGRGRKLVDARKVYYGGAVH